MILMQASHIEKQFDGRSVLEDASVLIQSGERVAIVGVNGSGKSTLLKIIMGTETADKGDISIAKQTTIGYAAQFIDANEDATVFSTIAKTFDHVYAMEHRLLRMEEEMSDPAVYSDETRFASLTQSYDRLRQQFLDADGYAIEARVRRVLDGLQFPSSMHNLPVSALSGGQKTRLSLAQVLAQQPELLILDEPTNYLDEATLDWLEGYLQSYDGAVLFISHDRYFLDAVATIIYELEDGRTTRFSGNYSDYIEEKANRFAQETKQYEAQQKEIERLETFINKNIVRATTTKRAQSRRKLLEKMVRLERPTEKTAKLALRFTCARTSGRDVLRMENLHFGYPDKPLPGPLSLTVHRGQRIAILGANGIGKTTLLKVITGQFAPLSGALTFGTHVDTGFYDQEQSDLDDKKTVLSQIWDEHPSMDLTTIRSALGRFLFRGEDVDTPVSALSGGERSRLALCRLMLTQSNFLIMDEPTNHLDLLSKEVLEDALAEYEGSLLFVSHDRYFIDALATHILVMDAAGFHLYLGNYTEYLHKRKEDEKLVANRDAESSTGGTLTAPKKPAGQALAPQVSPSERDLRLASNTPKSSHVRSADVRKLQMKIAQLEELITQLEKQHAEIATALTEAAMENNLTKIGELQSSLEQLEVEQLDKLAEWEEVSSALELLLAGS